MIIVRGQNSNTTQKIVTRERHIKINGPYAMFSRVLSFVLLSFIVYGTTVEAAHKHGGLADARTSAQENAFSEPGTRTARDGSPAGCDDCLICQLHQDFSTSLIVERDRSAPARTRLEISLATSATPIRLMAAPNRGRAPPFTS